MALIASMSTMNRMVRLSSNVVASQTRARSLFQRKPPCLGLHLIHRCHLGTTTTATTATQAHDDHIGRQLSTPNYSHVEQRKWEKLTKSFPKKWTHPVPEEYLVASPPYEHEALQQIHKLSFESNVLLEIRDVRLPASTHHPSFTRLAKYRTHLICYTHADMIDQTTRDAVASWTRRSWPKATFMFCDTREADRKKRGVDVFGPLYEWIATASDKSGGINCALTTGVANTGKSSVLASLLKYAKEAGYLSKVRANPITKTGKRARKHGSKKKGGSPEVQDTPGKTRELTEWMLRDSPRLFLLDVPGTTQAPAFFQERPETWYGMGAANLLVQSKAMRDDGPVQRRLCDYVLHCLNRNSSFQYVRKLNLDGPTARVDDCLQYFANKYVDQMDEDRLLLKRTEIFLKMFNTGNFGPIVLDDLSRPYEPFKFRDRHFQKEGREEQEKEDYDWNDEDDDDFRDRRFQKRGQEREKKDYDWDEDDDDWWKGR